MGRRAEFELTGEDREVLERWARRPTSAQAFALRCRIVLAAAEGEQTIDIAARLGCSRGTVSKWRGRFAERGLDGLHDKARPGKPRTISDQDVERVIVSTLEKQPADATHWSTRSMAAATGMSQTALSRIWRAFKAPPIQRWLLRHPRFRLHFTPTYSSWGQPRRALGLRTDHQTDRGSTHRSVRDLAGSIRTWIAP